MIRWDRDQNLIIAAILFTLALLTLMFCNGCALPPQGCYSAVETRHE